MGRDARPFWVRHGTAILSALVLAGVAGLGGWVLVQSAQPAYACDRLLEPPAATPAVSNPAPSPSPVPTPTASPTPTAAGSAAPTTPAPTPAPTPTPPPTPQLGVTVHDQGNAHKPAGTPLRYPECPPTSGTHYDTPTRRGYYGLDQSVLPGAWVHSLEHGMVVVAYSCKAGGGCPDQPTLDALKQFADTAPQTDVAKSCGIVNKLIVVRFDDMSTRFAALGWGRAMLTDTFDPALYLTFYGQWVDKAPTAEAKGCDT